MTKHYPTNDKVDFLTCETVRAETGGKLTLMGYYVGGSIILPASITLPAQIQLALVYVLRDGEGKFNCKLRIGIPAHKGVQEMDLPEVNKEPNKSHSITLNFLTFEVPRAGEYKFALMLDDQEYERVLPIEIRDFEKPS